MAVDEMGNGPGFVGIDKYTQQIKDNPNNFQAYSFRGQHYAAAGPSHYQQAIDDFTQEIEMAQKYAEAHGPLSTINKPGYIKRPNTNYYVRYYYSELIDTDYFIRDAYCKRAQVYLRAGQYQKAIDDCTKCINMMPKLSEIYWRLAGVEKAYGRDKAAKDDLNKAISLDPAIVGNRPLPAKMNGDRRQIDNTYDVCTSAIMSHQSNYEPYFFRAVAYEGLGKNREAIADLDKAIDCKPKDWRLFNMRGTAYEDLEQYPQAVDDYTQAIKLIKNGFKFIGKRVAILNHRADCYEKMGQIVLAKRDKYKAAHQSDINERK
jgi:tetratricopeptide (TPR) repeat protein